MTANVICNNKRTIIKVKNKTKKKSTTTTSGQYFKGCPNKTRERRHSYRLRKEEINYNNYNC